MSPSAAPSTILYIAARLPTLSETFVYRELLGLRDRGRRVLAASVYPPRMLAGDDRLATLKSEAITLYTARTAAVLPIILFWAPHHLIRAAADAWRADHASLPARAKHVFQAAMGLAAGWRLRKAGIEAVHAHMANTPAMVALYVARALAVPFSFTGHAADLFVQRTALAFKLREARFVSCISHWHRDFYAETAPVAADRLRLVRCSVALPAPAPGEGREIVTVARLIPKKGIDLLIDAFARARPPGWTLRILGGGPEHGALEAQVAALGLADSVVLEGARPHGACLAAIAGAGMFVLPCRTATNNDRDGIPVVLMEAMAAARPVIAGALPTIGELVADGESGLVVPPDDVAALAAAIRRLAGDAALRARLAQGARTRVAAEFSDAVNLDRLEAAFDGLPAPA